MLHTVQYAAARSQHRIAAECVYKITSSRGFIFIFKFFCALVCFAT
jgi:hypothetical protein